MQLEKNRHIQIVLYFSHNDRVITSEELATLTGASSRTIKSDITIINDVLSDNGAEIISKKSEGYQIIVSDKECFDIYRKKLEILYQYTAESSEIAFQLRIYAILRELLSSNEYCNIDNLADKLYLSRSTIKQDLQKVRSYLESYFLTLESKPNYGLRVCGEERQFRMAMLNAYGINVPTYQRSVGQTRYMEQLDAEDYDCVRRCLLDCLREYHYSIKDNASQGLARYLMVMRSRIRLDYGHIIFDEKTKKELAEFEIQNEITKDLFHRLEAFQGFDVSEDEKEFITMQLIAYHDYEGAEINEFTMKFLYKDIQKMYYECTSYIKNSFGLDDHFTRTREQLFYNVARLVVRNHFKMLPYNRVSFGISYEIAKKNPVAMNLASYLASYIEERLFCQLNSKDVLYLVHYFDELLDQIEFNYIPQRLVTVSALGKNYSQIIIDKIQHSFGNRVASNDAKELYEVRALSTKDIDLVVMDSLGYAYRYDIPYVVVDRKDLSGLDESIKNGYDIQQECEEIASMIKIYPDYEFHSQEECFRILSYKYGVDELSVGEMIKLFQRHEERVSYTGNSGVLLFSDYRFVQKQCIEIFKLKKGVVWNESTEVKTVVFLSADFYSNLKLMKALSCLMTTFAEEAGYLEKIINPDTRLEGIHEAILRQLSI